MSIPSSPRTVSSRTRMLVVKSSSMELELDLEGHPLKVAKQKCCESIYQTIRRIRRAVMIGNIAPGSDHPIRIQIQINTISDTMVLRRPWKRSCAPDLKCVLLVLRSDAFVDIKNNSYSEEVVNFKYQYTQWVLINDAPLMIFFYVNIYNNPIVADARCTREPK